MKRFFIAGTIIVAIIILTSCATTKSVNDLNAKVVSVSQTTQSLEAKLSKTAQDLQTNVASLAELRQKIDQLSAQMNELSLSKQEMEEMKGLLAQIQSKFDTIMYDTMAKIAEVLAAASQPEPPASQSK